MRADLVKDLADLHPGVFLFPWVDVLLKVQTLQPRYQWKNTVGDPKPST